LILDIVTFLLLQWCIFDALQITITNNQPWRYYVHFNMMI